MVPQLRRIDVIVAIRYDQRQRGKALDDLGPAFGPGEALQKLLQDEAGRQKRVGSQAEERPLSSAVSAATNASMR